MRELLTVIPDPDTYFMLTPEELGAQILFILNAAPISEQTFNVANLGHDIRADQTPFGGRNPYGARAKEAVAPLFEAIGWLEAQGLIIRALDQDSERGWRTLSRRGREIRDQHAFDHFRLAKLLPRELLDASIADRVWGSFMRGEYDTAAFQAMRQVEIAIREASGLDKLGVQLARAAFKPVDKDGDAGPLTERELEAGEQQGMMDLFAGALGALKNPHSHRIVRFENPADAAAAVIFASQLLRIVERRFIDRVLG